jgi:hypothetical protein
MQMVDFVDLQFFGQSQLRINGLTSFIRSIYGSFDFKVLLSTLDFIVIHIHGGPATSLRVHNRDD